MQQFATKITSLTATIAAQTIFTGPARVFGILISGAPSGDTLTFTDTDGNQVLKTQAQASTTIEIHTSFIANKGLMVSAGATDNLTRVTVFFSHGGS